MPAPTNHTKKPAPQSSQQTCRRLPGVPAENSDAVSRARHPYRMSSPSSHCDPALSRRLELGSNSGSMDSSPRWWWASPPPPWGLGGTAGKWWGLGGLTAVKAAACLLFAGIAFRMLCPFSKPSPWPEVSKGSGALTLIFCAVFRGCSSCVESLVRGLVVATFGLCPAVSEGSWCQMVAIFVGFRGRTF
jgi:hypothetical protein